MVYRDSTYVSGAFDFYLFAKNAQGDILYIYNTSGTRLATYTYDAWGKCYVTYQNGGASTSARYNPFRYRGYYYDTETGFYYLNSRYYDPELGRFLNADGYINGNGDILGFNMFAYCSNNPVMYKDPSGGYYDFWNQVYEIPYPGYFHRKVQEHIVENYPGYKYEQWCSSGRIDICNPDTNAIYEIKSQATGINAARDQLNRYLNASQYHAGDELIGGSFNVGEYTVTYYTAEKGIILYYAERTHNGKLQRVFYGVPVPQNQKKQNTFAEIMSDPTVVIACGITLSMALVVSVAVNNFNYGGGNRYFEKCFGF